MRLLFERDLTPHPQYAAFYNWLQHDFKASAVLHFGMHGTVEWLPGAPLGPPLSHPIIPAGPEMSKTCIDAIKWKFGGQRWLASNHSILQL